MPTPFGGGARDELLCTTIALSADDADNDYPEEEDEEGDAAEEEDTEDL